ncbi:MAG TPA: cytochrome c [Gemmatimonadaceae bacterium]|nr:cytochrome c [Gemmatimonadaceae bacterium]
MMRHFIVGFAAVAAIGCGERGGSGGTSTGAAAAPATTVAANAAVVGGSAPRFADLDAGAVPGGPGAGKRYGLGARAGSGDVAKWDTDVGPDGAELPPGRGSVADGQRLYLAQCMMCHNKNGEGLPPLYPALIGRDPKAEGFHFASDPKLVKTIGNYWPNATTVFDYVKRAMPLTAPGSLTNDQVYALTAFLLAANEVIPKDAVLDAKALRAVTMPYADKFVPDDRKGGPEVK